MSRSKNKCSKTVSKLKTFKIEEMLLETTSVECVTMDFDDFASIKDGVIALGPLLGGKSLDFVLMNAGYLPVGEVGTGHYIT